MHAYIEKDAMNFKPMDTKQYFFDIELFLLSHLLIAGCDIGVQISVRPFVRPSVNIYVEV